MKYFLVLLSIAVSTSARGASIDWQEVGYNARSPLKHGVPAFDETTVRYERKAGSALNIVVGKPIVVSVAEKPEKWGYFQFPGIRATRDGSLLVATWNMKADSVESYGKGMSAPNVAVSKDGGKTWALRAGEDIRGDSGVLLPNGDRIQVHTPKALKVSELQLPTPLDSRKEAYGRQFALYKASELPEQLQGVYLSRMAKGSDKWVVEHDLLDDPALVRQTDNDWFPLIWWGDIHVAADGSAIAGVYPGFYLDETNKVSPSGIAFYRSTDFGRTWKVRGRIPYEPDLKVDPNGDKRLALGYTEPAFEILPNGTYLCILRTSDGLGVSPMYRSTSDDMGVTWTKPVAFTRNGVLPKLLQLENGVLVLGSGRPGMQLRFSTDGRGEQWTDPFDIVPFENIKGEVSCGYPRFLPTGPGKFLLIYSDFNHVTEAGEIRKAIKVREVGVEKVKPANG